MREREHTRVICLELLEEFLLSLFIASWAPGLFLALIIHHLLNHRTGLAVQVAQARVLRGNFGDVDLGRGGDHMWPPFNFIGFVEVDIDFFAWGSGGCLQSPRGFVDDDWVR